MRKFLAATLLIALASAAPTAKPGGGGGGGGGASPPPNAEVGYRVLGGKTVKLMVANADATNATTLYTSPSPFDFDLGPPSTKAIAIVDRGQSGSMLRLVTYGTSGSGALQTQSVVALTATDRSSTVDFSPDGTKIAFVCCYDGEYTLAVYDLNDGSVTPWATGPFFWSLTWFRGGSSIAYSNGGNPPRLYELAGPGEAPQLLFSSQGEITVDAVHGDSNKLVVSYNDSSGDARIGLFDADSKAFDDPNIANSTRSWQGNLDCSDRRLAYMGVQNTSGSQAFYIRDRQTGLTSLFSKSSNILLQFFPCG